MRKHLMGALLATALVSPAALAFAEAKSFADPEAAAAAVIEALRAQDRAALLEVFGPESEEVIVTGDPERDRQDREDFIAAFEEMNRVTIQDDTATLYIGADQWPFPIPLKKGEQGWAFDVEAGREEMLTRRIGRNELDVIELLQAYVRVQAAYRGVDYDGDGVMEFAPHVLSTPGTRDGLYWPPEDGAPESPVGDFIARAAAEGYSVNGQDAEPVPYLGYYYHILTKQGENAPGGAMDYMINGNLLAGHAVIAFPSAYGDTGIMSFMVNENGQVLEADLGEDTLEIANAIDVYDPGEEWSPVEAEPAN